MILSEELGSGRYLVVTQTDHAFFAGELLSLWRSDGLPTHPRRADLLFAAREHDNGWREPDSAPAVDRAVGRPMDFLQIDSRTKVEVWMRGPARYAQERPYSSALIAEHALAVFAERECEEPWRSLCAGLRERQQLWLTAAGQDKRSLADDYPWLDRADRISLLACGAATVSAPAGHRVRRRLAASPDGSAQLEVDPFPLAGATTFRVPCRRVSARTYAGDADFAVELATAPWETLTVQVREYSLKY